MDQDFAGSKLDLLILVKHRVLGLRMLNREICKFQWAVCAEGWFVSLCMVVFVRGQMLLF